MKEKIIQLVSIIKVHQEILSKYQGIIDSSSDMRVRLIYYPKISLKKKEIRKLQTELKILRTKVKTTLKQKRKKIKNR